MGIAGHYPVIRRAITITTANQGIRFREGATTATVNVPAGTYYLRETGTDGILPAIVDAIEAQFGGNTYSFAVLPNPLSTPIAATDANAIGSLARNSGSADFQLLGADALTTFPLDAIGFDEVNTALDANAKAATLSASGWWVGNDLLAVDEDAQSGEVFGDDPSRGGLVVAGAHSDVWQMRRWGVQYQLAARTWREYTPTDRARSWSDFWGRWVRSGTVLELVRITNGTSTEYEEWDTVTAAFTTSPTTIGKWVADKATRSNVGPIRKSAGTPLYAWPLVFQRWLEP